MPPGILGSQLTATPPMHIHSTMEESSFLPAISRKSDISICSESDPKDFCNTERRIHTRGSVPASLSSSPLKFPTIDRANSTSVASLPGSRSTRHRSITKEFRNSFCRSPSCPSHLDIRKDFNHDMTFFKHHNDSYRETPEGEIAHSPCREDSGTIFPSIFSTGKDTGRSNNNSRTEKGKGTSRREKNQEKSLTLRRTESLMNACVSSGETSNPASTRDTERQSHAAALLLPLRNTNSQSNKKKKKRRQRAQSEEEVQENTPRNTDTDNNYKSRARFNRKTDEAIDAMARENDLYDDSDMETPRAVEINSSRKVKQWINNNKHTHPENEIKA